MRAKISDGLAGAARQRQDAALMSETAGAFRTLGPALPLMAEAEARRILAETEPRGAGAGWYLKSDGSNGAYPIDDEGRSALAESLARFVTLEQLQ